MADERDGYDLADAVEEIAMFVDMSMERSDTLNAAAAKLRELENTIQEIESAAQDRDTLS